MKKLIVVSSSSRRLKEPTEPIPALERYTGIYFKLLKKYEREKRLKNVDVLIVSERFGILHAEDRIPYHEPFSAGYGVLKMKKGEMKKLRERNLKKLKEVFDKTDYSEIFVNVGKQFFELIRGFETLTKAKIVYASGPGLGPKAQHMKKWILSIKK